MDKIEDRVRVFQNGIDVIFGPRRIHHEERRQPETHSVFVHEKAVVANSLTSAADICVDHRAHT